MKNNPSIYEHFRGNEQLVKRIFDLVDRMQRSYQVVHTPFLTPAQQEVCTRILGNQISYQLCGGYKQAENQCLLLLPEYIDEKMISIPVQCLKATYMSKFHTLKHRDVLGAMMNLGLKREQFGDVLVHDDNIYIFVMEDIASYVIANLTKIGRHAVQFVEWQEDVEKVEDIDYYEVIVSSFRLDVIVATLCHISRSKAQQFIQGKLVKVNHLVLEDCDVVCNNNSIISIRGYGRFLLIETKKTTKSGRYVIEIGKYK